MSKQNGTYKITKVKNNGDHWTDKIVGKSALNKYMDKMAENLASDRGRVNSINITALGRREEDIEEKEIINLRCFKNIKSHDWYDEEDTEDEGEQEERKYGGVRSAPSVESEEDDLNVLPSD